MSRSEAVDVTPYAITRSASHFKGKISHTEGAYELVVIFRLNHHGMRRIELLKTNWFEEEREAISSSPRVKTLEPMTFGMLIDFVQHEDFGG